MKKILVDPSLVRIVELPPSGVASCVGFGKNPEALAWKGLFDWMGSRAVPIEGSRFFGFNNPNPAPGNPNYGYEQWLILDDEAKRGASAAPPACFKRPEARAGMTLCSIFI